MNATIITKNYYIIKVTCDNGKLTYFKIGESKSIARPEALVEKYKKLRASDATLLLFEELPHSNKARLNDKLIHDKLDPNVLKRADSVYIQHYLGESDGCNEFFQAVNTMTDQEVVDYVKSVVASIKKTEYRAKSQVNYTLNFKQKHLVNNKLIEEIFAYKPIENTLLYNGTKNTILLIGQFLPDFVNSFAMFNNVIVWHDANDQKYTYDFERINDNIKYIETGEELINMDIKFNLILANPPYGKPGANITKNIIDNIEFDTFINLLPANDYKRNDDGDLFQYQRNMRTIPKGFTDAMVTTHLAEIVKVPNNLTLDEFEISTYVDRDLTKYFTENRHRPHQAIDEAISWLSYNNCNNVTDVVLPHKFLWSDVYYNKIGAIVREKRLSSKKDGVEYQWNHRLLDGAALAKANLSPSTPGKINKYVIKFKTAIEKDNFVNFIYSDTGFRFMGKILMALNSDSTVELFKWIPKVDWTRSWTVEEILADYGYTQKEIDEVMADLINFKGMED